MLITFFKVRNRFRMEEIRLYDSPFKELADQVHLEILNLGLNDTRLLSKQYLMTISLQESSFAELFSIACRWYSPYKTSYHREKYDEVYTYIFHIWNFRKYGIICIAIYRMIPDEESGIRNGNVRVSKYFCNPCSIYRAKTPGFILWHYIYLYTSGDFVGPWRRYQVGLSRPCHSDGAGRKNWFYYKKWNLRHLDRSACWNLLGYRSDDIVARSCLEILMLAR